MGHMLQDFTDGLGHARRYIEAAALAAHNVPGYRPQHGRDGGEMANTLHDAPVLLRYVLTWDGQRELAEVTDVSIGGHSIPAAYFDADTVQEWGRDCMRARAAAGMAS